MLLETTVTMGDLSGIVTGIASVGTWFWGIFTDLVNMIVSNNLLLWPCVLAICCGAFGLAAKLVRKFGLKGRK